MNKYKAVMFVLDSFWPNQDGVSIVVQYLSEGPIVIREAAPFI